MFEYWRAIDAHRQQIRLQWVIIVFLTLCSGLLWLGWSQAPKKLTVYLPPDLAQGVTQSAHKIPTPFLASFALQVWQAIYYWSSEQPNDQGEYVYQQRLKTYGAYLTPRFRQALWKDYDDLKARQLLHRTRLLQNVSKQPVVKQIAPGIWQITLTVDLIEYEGSMQVRNIRIRYPLRVVRLSISPTANPYQLALDGFVSPPIRIKETP